MLAATISRLAAIGVTLSLALGPGPTLAQARSDLSRRVCENANRVGCHKWHGGGGGGGGYGGAAFVPARDRA